MKYKVVKPIHFGIEANAHKGDILTVGMWSNGEDDPEPMLMKEDEAVCSVKGFYVRECCQLIEQGA